MKTRIRFHGKPICPCGYAPDPAAIIEINGHELYADFEKRIVKQMYPCLGCDRRYSIEAVWLYDSVTGDGWIPLAALTVERPN